MDAGSVSERRISLATTSGATPPELRNRALALASAGLMFTQGLGFAFWGLIGQYVPLPVTIPLAAAAGTVAVLALWPGSAHRAIAAAAA